MYRLGSSLLLLSLLFVGCKASQSTSQKGSLEELQAYMMGNYDSRLQASSDSSYLEISLKMQAIWPQQPGKWLYVEQARYEAQDRPYRQRIYQLEAGPKGSFLSRVYELPDPTAFVGGAAQPAIFDALSPKDLLERAGCAVILRKDESGIYRGSTNQKDCPSSLRGATYATSRVSVHATFIQSWDQGFDANDEQVWGATEGGYMFLKQK